MAKPRILIIDDEALIRQSLADFLSEFDYVTETAADGVQGLERVQAEQYDIVLVDLRMPRMDGLEVIARLKADRPFRPVVVVSGTGVLTDAVEALRRGADDYITKPIQDLEEVVIVIERVLEKAQLRAERNRYQRELEQLNRSLEAQVDRQTRDLRMHNRELTALNWVSSVISASLDLDSMLNHTIDAAVESVEAEGGMVWLINPTTGRLSLAAVRGLPGSFRRATDTILQESGVVGRVAQDGAIAQGSGSGADPCLVLGAGESLGEEASSNVSCSYLCVPLRAGGEGGEGQGIVGVLGVIVRDQRDFDTRETDLLTSIGNQIGVGVARIRHAIDLQRSNLQLEQLVTELRRLDTLREQFIQNVAHELRTPLALVYGYLEMLAQGDMDFTRLYEIVGGACKGAKRLVMLVESITTLQDLGSGPLETGPIEPAELLRTAKQMASQYAQSAGIQLRDECPSDISTFSGDYTRLAQALHQLLDNACKFSPAGSTVTISCDSDGGVMSISIADQGIGIDRKEHQNIFSRFYQVDGSTTRRYGGAGLGLAVAREIAEAHNGGIDITSAEGKGSTFTLWLPLVKSES